MRPGAGGSPRPFRPRALVVAALVVGAALHGPVFTGRLPLPADTVLSSPAWDAIRSGIPPAPPHAEMGDLAAMTWVWRSYAGESLREGRLPLWNPRILAGTPFLANLTSAVLYPPNLLVALLPLPVAWAATFVLRTALAFLFAALLARELDASRAGQLLAGLAFALGGFSVVWQGWDKSDVAVWLPASVLALERLARRPGPLRAALAALALATAFLAGHPETFLYVAATAAGWAAFRLLRPPDGEAGAVPRVSFAAWAAAAFAAVPFLVAVQLVPFLEWMGQLSRGLDAVWAWRAPWTALVTLVSRDARSTPSALGIEVPEWSAYAGAVSLALAPFAFLSRRRAEALFFFGVSSVVVLVLYGNGQLSSLARSLPLLRSLPQARLLLLVSFSLALLAGLGLTGLQRVSGTGGAGPRAARLASLAALACAALGIARAGAAAADPRRAFAGEWGVASSLLFLGLAALLVAASRLSGPGPAALGLAALLLAALDLGSFAFGHVPFVPASLALPEPAVYRFLRAEGASAGRVLSVDATLATNMEVLFGLSTPHGYDTPTRLHRRLLDPLTDRAQPVFISSARAARLVASPGRRLDLLSVRWLLATSWNDSEKILSSSPARFRRARTFHSLVLFENLRALPRAFLVPASGARAATREEAWAALDDPAFDPERSVLLEGGDGPSAKTAAGAGPGRVVAIEDGGERVDVRVEVAEPSVLVLADAWYPGWEVEVDGRAARLLRANAAFRAVVLPAGARSVSFLYRPLSFRLGAALSIAALAVVLGALVFGRATSARGPRPSAGRASRSPRSGAS